MSTVLYYYYCSTFCNSYLVRLSCYRRVIGARDAFMLCWITSNLENKSPITASLLLFLYFEREKSNIFSWFRVLAIFLTEKFSRMWGFILNAISHPSLSFGASTIFEDARHDFDFHSSSSITDEWSIDLYPS